MSEINKNLEEKDPARKRELIKTLLIIFLAAMLVLTFCSNTIMNRSLAEISTEMAVSGKLTERVRGSGMVESNQSYDVTIDENKTISTINIKVGQLIEKGDVLFTVGGEESEAVTMAETELEALELDYQKSLLTIPFDYSSQNQAISNAREDLNRAITLRNQIANNAGTVQAEKEIYHENKRKYTEKTALKEKLSSALMAVRSDSYDEAPLEYIGQLQTLCADWMNADKEYQTAYELYTDILRDGGDSEAAKSEADAKKILLDTAKTNYETEKAVIRSDLTEKIETADSELADLERLITDYESNGGSGSEMTYEMANEDVIAKQRALSELIISLSKEQKTDGIQQQQSALDLEAKKKEIDRKREKLEKLKKDNAETEIKSKYSGIVSSINVKPDETAVPGVPLAVIDISSEGYTVQVTVDGEKARKVKKGSKAEIMNSWGSETEAVLTDIKSDNQSGSKNRILVFSVTGDVESGSFLDLSIPCGSGNYDALVPKSSVYEDSKGKFVLTVRSKSTPLGNRYYAERVNVDVKASDEVASAVEGNISQGTYVITTASKPVKAGDQVRMK